MIWKNRSKPDYDRVYDPYWDATMMYNQILADKKVVSG